MKHYNFSDSSINAFCLHPIFQADDLFAAYGTDVINNQKRYNLYPKDIMLALEYRNIANAYLSFRKINSLSEISLSPLEEVNQMLIADKIQNYKDFMLYHYNKHERSKELYEYFHNWFSVLKVDINEANSIIEDITNFRALKKLL